MLLLIKSKEFLADLISGNGYISSAFSRQIHALTQESPAQAKKQRQIHFSKIVPQLLLFLHIFFHPRFNGKNRGYRHHNFQISNHIMAKLPAENFWFMVIAQHQLCYTNLLIYPANHHLFIDRLIFSSNIISVEILIHIIHLTYMWKRIIYIDIIHIERMLR